MLQEIIDVVVSPQGWDWKARGLITLLVPFIVTYVYTSFNAARARRASKQQQIGQKRGLIFPYAVPVLGHMFSFAADGGKLLAQAVRYAGPDTPIKVLFVPSISRYVIKGHDMVSAFFRETRAWSGVVDELQMFEHGFGASREAVAFYAADDSGVGTTPIPGTNVDPENRVFHIKHKMVSGYLSGQSLQGITLRFQQNLARLIEEDTSVGVDWVELPDLQRHMERLVMSAAVQSIFGTYILSLNPTLIEDFFAFSAKVGPLFLAIPRWLDPKAHRLRAKVLNAVIRWQKYAHEHTDCSEDDVEWEPYLGCKFSRERQSQFQKWDQMDAASKAAEDLGIIWASNANSVPAACWHLYEILKDKALKSKVRDEMVVAQLPTASSTAVPIFDIEKLCAGPYLQSIYAETLRLRVGVLASRRVQVPEMQFRGWNFKEGECVAIASSIEARNPEVWSQGGDGNPHPLDEFWAERFLIYPGDPATGPLKNPRISKAAPGSIDVLEMGIAPKFSMEGLTTAWIPYSGGQRLCPGRHFAKQEMISASAILLSAFDIELLDPTQKVRENKAFYGFGTMPPKEKIAVRIKRRVR